MQAETAHAALEDLAREPGKAELVGGVLRFMPAGARPGRIGGRIYHSLDEYCDRTGSGAAFPVNVGFAVRRLAGGRELFSPDAAYYDGPALARPPCGLYRERLSWP